MSVTVSRTWWIACGRASGVSVMPPLCDTQPDGARAELSDVSGTLLAWTPLPCCSGS